MMTATCTPYHEREIPRMLGIERCLVIRAPTPRPEISYNVSSFNSEEPAEDWLVDSFQMARKFYGRGDKGLVFCRGHKMTEKLAARLNCPSLHRDRRSPSEIRDTYDRFLKDDRQQVIVATSLLGAGVDIPHVRNVWHFGIPWSVIDFAQETGRAARDGGLATSYVVTWKSELDRTPTEPQYTEDDLRQWLVQQSGCRRTLIAEVLDRKPTSCLLLEKPNLCDHCREVVVSHKPRPDSGVGFFQNPEPAATGTPPTPRPPQLSTASSSSSNPLPSQPSGSMVSPWVPLCTSGSSLRLTSAVSSPASQPIGTTALKM